MAILAVLQVWDHHSHDSEWEEPGELGELATDMLVDVCGYVIAETERWLVLSQVLGNDRRVQNTWRVYKPAILHELRNPVLTANDLERRRG